MIRLFHVYFPGRTLLLVVMEAFLIMAAFLTASYIRFGPDAELQLVYEHGLWRILTAALVCMLCMHYYDLYGAFAIRGLSEMVARVVQVLGTACLILAILYYLYPALRLSFSLVALWVTLTCICLALTRRLFLIVNGAPKLATKALLLGDGPLSAAVCSEISDRPELGITVTGYVAARENESLEGDLKYLGVIGDLAEVVETERIERIVLTLADRRGTLPLRELMRLKNRGIQIQDGGDLLEAVTGKVAVANLRPSWFLLSDGFRISRWKLFYKRFAALLFSCFGLLIAAPVIALAAIAVRLDSAGPAIFRQKRVGKDGRLFTLYKLRTMYIGAENDGNFKPAQTGDPRITRVGKWLRRMRLDELPQLFNILQGDMSFIGPRPFTPNMEAEYVERIPFYEQRWTIKPGATGWAQVRHGYCSTLEDNIEKLSYDLYYIKNLSIGLDLLVFFETAKILLLGRGSR